MSSEGASHRLGYGVLWLGVLIFLAVSFRGYHDTVVHGIDFKIVYSSSKCLLDGCDPYDSRVLHQEYMNAGGDLSPDSDASTFQRFPALYPPFSLFLVFPFAVFPFKLSLALWMTASAVLFVIAAFLMADLCRPWRSQIPLILLGLFVASSTMLVTTAQPSSFAISLCAIAVWSLVSSRMPVTGTVCFALSLVLKPQIAGLVLVYFLLAAGPARRRAMIAFAATAAFCIPGLLWAAKEPAAAHWPQAIRTNLAGSTAPGSINDPGPSSFTAMMVTDLQSVFAVVDDEPQIYNLESYLVAGVLMLAWAYVALRAEPSTRKNLLGVATMACLSLLPLYHRHYDVRLLLLTFPGLAVLVDEGGWESAMAIAASIAVLCGSHPTFIRDHLSLRQETLGPLKTILLMRTAPLAVLFSGLVYLGCFATMLKGGNRLPMESVKLRQTGMNG
jgi:hypothetical protein